MKNTKKIIAMVSMVLVIGLIIFAGCSKSNTDLQTTPNGKQILATTNTNMNTNFEYKILKNQYTTINPRLSNMKKDYFLQLLYSSIKIGKLEFIHKNDSLALLNKLEVVINMINNNNYQGALNKIKKDITNFINNFVVEDQRYSAIIAIEGTEFILKNGCEDIYLNVDYYDYENILNAYAWTQSVNGDKSCILQLEGSKNVYENDPIFYVLSNIQEVAGGYFKDQGYGAPGACTCPYPASSCQCHWLEVPNPVPSPIIPYEL